MLADVRYALRTILKRPGFAVAAMGILTVGIAANTVVFSLLNSLAFRPMPVPDARRVVRISPVNADGRAGNAFSYPDYVDYRTQSGDFVETLAAYMPADVTAGRSSVDRAAAAPGSALAYVVSSNYFDLTGVRPALGRVLHASDDTPTARAVVLSHAFWQRRFGGNPLVLGATIDLNAVPFVIVGVAEPAFAGTEPLVADAWMPLGALSIAVPDSGGVLDRRRANVLLVGRLREGVASASAAAAFDVIARRLAVEYPGSTRPAGVRLASSAFFTIDPAIRPVIATALTLVGLVLLIACGNVANLMLARAVSRQREIAVRLAIGASRWRLVRQLVIEALLLSITAGAAALLVSTWVLRVLYRSAVALVPFPWAVALTLAPDIRVFAYTLALATAGGLVLGLVPALQTSSPNLVQALHERTIGGRGVSGTRIRAGLVVLQVAGSLVLLMAAGLLLRGLHSARALDLGFKAADVVFTGYDLRGQRYSLSRAAAFNAALAERARGVAGVVHVAFTSHVPLHGGVRRIAVRLGAAPSLGQVDTVVASVSPEYFDVLRLPFTAGHAFTASSDPSTSVIVSEGLARRFWRGEPALGKVMTSPAWAAPRTVTGVVRDSTNVVIWRDKEMSVYVPLDPAADADKVTAIVSTDGDPAAVSAGLVSIAATLDPNLRFEATRLDELLRLWILPSRVAAAAAGVLAVLALFLASFGVYAVLSFAVTQRTREIGIRMALGANVRDVSRLVLRDAARVTAVGLVVGGACTALAAPLLRGLIFGVSPFDPLTIAVVCAVLASAAGAASYVPARRASRLPPLAVLRVE